MLEIDSLLLVLITTEHLLQMKKKQFVIHLEILILHFSSNDCPIKLFIVQSTNPIFEETMPLLNTKTILVK